MPPFVNFSRASALTLLSSLQSAFFVNLLDLDVGGPDLNPQAGIVVSWVSPIRQPLNSTHQENPGRDLRIEWARPVSG